MKVLIDEVVALREVAEKNLIEVLKMCSKIEALVAVKAATSMEKAAKKKAAKKKPVTKKKVAAKKTVRRKKK